MIQRKQSLYLLLVVVLNALLLNLIPLWEDDSNSWVYVTNFTETFLAVSASIAMALITIFSFKNRKLQFVLGRINIIINFFVIGFIVYTALHLPGENNVSEKGIGGLVPLISIVFLVLANKAIKKDEDLVKSVDRFR